MVFARHEVGASIPGFHPLALVVVEGMDEPCEPISEPVHQQGMEALDIKTVQAVGRGHEVDQESVFRQAPTHHEEAEEPLPLRGMPGGQTAVGTPTSDVGEYVFEGGVEQAAVALQVLDGPPGATGLEAQEKPVGEFRVGVVTGFPTDGREAVFHFVAVVESFGGVHPPFVAGLEVRHAADPAVDVERRALLVGTLGLERKGDVGRTGNGLVGDLDFLRCPLQDCCDSRFGMAALAKGNPGPNPLAGDGVGHEDGEIAVLRGDLGDAFSAEGDIEDVQLEHLALVEESGFAWQRGELCGETPVKGAKIRWEGMLPCPP